MSLAQAVQNAIQFVSGHPNTMTRAEVDEFHRLSDAVYDLAHAAGLAGALPKVDELLPQLQSDELALPPVQFEGKLNLPGDWDRPAPLDDDELLIMRPSLDPDPEPPAKPTFRVCASPRWREDMERLLRRAEAREPKARRMSRGEANEKAMELECGGGLAHAARRPPLAPGDRSMLSSASVPSHIDFDALDLTTIVSAASGLLDRLEEYHRSAITYQHRVCAPSCRSWIRVHTAALFVEGEMARLGLAPRPPVQAAQGKAEWFALVDLCEWLFSARGETTAGWGERLGTGLWAPLPLGTQRLPDVTSWLAPLRLTVETLRKAAATQPPGAPDSSPPVRTGTTLPATTNGNAKTVPARRGRRINERMEEMFKKDARRLDLSVEEWAKELGCSKSTVHGTQTWNLILNTRAMREVEKHRRKDGEGVDRRRFRKKPQRAD
jgi:hypothetical protein